MAAAASYTIVRANGKIKIKGRPQITVLQQIALPYTHPCMPVQKSKVTFTVKRRSIVNCSSILVYLLFSQRTCICHVLFVLFLFCFYSLLILQQHSASNCPTDIHIHSLSAFLAWFVVIILGLKATKIRLPSIQGFSCHILTIEVFSPWSNYTGWPDQNFLSVRYT